MQNPWKHRLTPAALGLALIALAGCDAAEQSAQKLAEEAKKEVQALISDSVGEVVDEVNRQVDSCRSPPTEHLARTTRRNSRAPRRRRWSPRNRSSRASKPDAGSVAQATAELLLGAATSAPACLGLSCSPFGGVTCRRASVGALVNILGNLPWPTHPQGLVRPTTVLCQVGRAVACR